MNKRRSILVAVTAASLALAGFGPGPCPAAALGDAPPTVLGAPTPELLVARLNRALTLPAAEGQREMLACLESSWRASITGLALMVVSAIAAGIEKAVLENDQGTRTLHVRVGSHTVDARKVLEAYSAVVAKHRLPAVELKADDSEDAQLARFRAAVDGKDHLALMADLKGIVFMLLPSDASDTSDTSAGIAAEVAWSRTELRGLRIQGDRATLRRGKKRLELVRQQGRWLLSAPPAAAH